MNYLFFDIECCDGIHMCSFGYVIVNSNFEILEKDDINMNPHWRFRKGKDGFNILNFLDYPKQYYMKEKPFNYYYKRIKSLLTDENNVLLGHNVASDINFLNIACRRYDIEEFKLLAYDTQNFYYHIL